MKSTALRVSAPAKVNLALEVTGFLPDGYHALDTVFAWLELADELELEPAPATRLQIESGTEGGLEVPEGEGNLVLQAARALEQEVGRELPTLLRLRRRIPAGAGLGGGSADAAAALLGLIRLHRLPLGPRELLPLAARLGSDVAFGLMGGACRGRGRGERLQPLPPPPDMPVVLLFPGYGLPTREVYRAWDGLPPAYRHPGAGSARRVSGALREGRLPPSALGNDLEAGAEALVPELAELRRAMEEAGCRAARLCGSGSALFGLVEGADPDAVARRLRGRGDVLVTRFRRQGR